MSFRSQRKTKGALVFFGILAFLGAACVTTVKEEEIPADLSAAIFFQRAQEYVDQEQWSAALTYLTVFKQRYPTDLEHQVEADYLIANVAYKQGKLVEARQKYQAILDRYSESDAATLPERFKILAARLIDAIDKKDPSAKEKAIASPSPAVNPSPSASPQG